MEEGQREKVELFIITVKRNAVSVNTGTIAAKLGSEVKVSKLSTKWRSISSSLRPQILTGGATCVTVCRGVLVEGERRGTSNLTT